MVLADTEAFFLFRADHVSNQIAEQTPLEQLALPWLHRSDIGASIQMQGQQPPHRLFGEKEDPAGRQYARDFRKDAFQVHELAERLTRHDEPDRVIAKRQFAAIACDSNRRSCVVP